MSHLVTCLLLLLSWPQHSGAAAQFFPEQATVARLFTLMDERLALMPDVAAWKWKHGAAVTDRQREQEIIDRTIAQAAPLGLSADALRRLLELQFDAARDVQTDLYGRWQGNGFDASQTVRSLQGELRPQLDRLTAQWVRALYLAAPEFERPDFAAVYAPLAQQRLRNAAWSQEIRQRLLDALASTRLAPTPALERVRAAGVLRIGTTGDYAPFSFASGDRLSGADIELAAALAGSLAVKPYFVRTSWPTLLMDLQRNKFDLAISGISITSQREAVAAFSVPYHSGGKTIIARCRDAPRFGDLAGVDRPDVRVIVNSGGTNEQYVREHLRRASIRVLPDNHGVFQEILTGRADVMITDDVEVDFQTRQHRDLCRAMQGTLTQAAKAILLPRDQGWVEAVNDWLAVQLQTGEPARLLHQARP